MLIDKRKLNKNKETLLPVLYGDMSHEEFKGKLKKGLEDFPGEHPSEEDYNYVSQITYVKRDSNDLGRNF